MITHVASAVRMLATAGVGAWSVLALGYAPSGPSAATVAVAGGLTCVLVTAMVMARRARSARRRWIARTAMVAACAAVIGWFLVVPPPADADWLPECAEAPTVEWGEGTVTVRGIRDFGYRTSDTDAEPRWVDRTFELDRIRTADLIFSSWGPKLICHTFVSFGFERPDGGMEHVAVSIEVRKRKGQSYSAIGGMFRQFTLIYVWATERDVVGVRAKFRGEDLRRYRLAMPPEEVRVLFERYAIETEALARHPRWYNAVTQSCGVDIMRTAWGDRMPLFPPLRMLLNGTWEERAWEDGRLDRTRSFEAVRAEANITADARDAPPDEGFGAAIRRRDVVMEVRAPGPTAGGSP
jgi:hypothetical protein